MPLTALDPNTALVVVDLQKGIVGSPPAPSMETMVERNCRLVKAFRARGLPVILVNVTDVPPGRTDQPKLDTSTLPEDFADLLPELGRQPDDIVVTKRSQGAFATTDLEKRLRSSGVTQVVITGVATGSGVESTARQAYELGFNVTLAIDAMTDRRPDAHDHSVRSVFPRLGETGSTDAVIALLNERV